MIRVDVVDGLKKSARLVADGFLLVFQQEPGQVGWPNGGRLFPVDSHRQFPGQDPHHGGRGNQAPIPLVYVQALFLGRLAKFRGVLGLEVFLLLLFLKRPGCGGVGHLLAQCAQVGIYPVPSALHGGDVTSFGGLLQGLEL